MQWSKTVGEYLEISTEKERTELNLLLYIIMTITMTTTSLLIPDAMTKILSATSYIFFAYYLLKYTRSP